MAVNFKDSRNLHSQQIILKIKINRLNGFNVLTALRTSDLTKIFARESQKSEAPFVCPSCNYPVIIRKGLIKTHHFAHKSPPISCYRGKGESEQHLSIKLAIFDSLRQQDNVKNSEVEKHFGISIADVYAEISGVPVAIEIQKSILTAAQITARTSNYHRLGIAVLWIALPSDTLMTGKYSPSAWEKWCHATFFGRMYYWEEGQKLRPVHFNPYMIEVPVSTWYDQSANEVIVGGYDRFSKRWKVPVVGNQVEISKDFKIAFRSSWSGGNVIVPDCTLYLDKQEKWWEKSVFKEKTKETSSS